MSSEKRLDALPPEDLTGLLRAWSQGSEEAGHALLPVVYEELRRLAARALARERQGHTLQPTALVHEAFLRLSGRLSNRWHNRQQFFALAATMMRRVLVDHARKRNTAKRGGEVLRVQLDEARDLASHRGEEILTVDRALRELAAMDPFKGRLVELRYFGGLTVAETAQVLDCSIDTVTRHWRSARAWLAQELRGPDLGS